MVVMRERKIMKMLVLIWLRTVKLEQEVGVCGGGGSDAASGDDGGNDDDCAKCDVDRDTYDAGEGDYSSVMRELDRDAGLTMQPVALQDDGIDGGMTMTASDDGFKFIQVLHLPR